MSKIIKGWKNINKDLKCRNFQFEVGKDYHQDGKIELCRNGFHFHESSLDIFKYYDRKKSIVVEIEASGEIKTGDNKSVCSDIKIIRILSNDEMKKICNLVNNIGLHNSGDQNSGNRNSGYRNSGYRNSGNLNSGNLNSGNLNSGYQNSGYQNSGDQNSGDQNSGDWNSGDQNSGNRNSGDHNSGDQNSGNRNSGYRNSGYRNSGDKNSGNRNSGDKNSGDKNSGDQNSGNRNSGDKNSGDWNSSNMNNGFFNSKKNETVMVFNRPCKIKRWQEAIKPSFIYFNLTNWVSENNMTDQEKIDNPKFYTAQGYLKTFSYKDAWKQAWDKKSDNDLKLLEKLPNFSWKVFTQITGIKKSE